YGFISEGYWCDIGNHDQYMKAHRAILDGDVKVNIKEHRLRENIWMGDGVEIDETAELTGPLLLGNHVKVERGSKVREYSVLGNNVVVKQDNFIHRTVVMDNTYIGPSCHIRGSVIGRNCDVKSGVRIGESSIIGDDCLIGNSAVINPGIVIFPFKTVDSWATVNSSIIWESGGRRSPFGKRGVSGLVNVDITPEKATRLGLAHGSFLPVNSQVVTSRDGTRAARTIKRAYMSGLNAAGVHVRDLEVSATPVNRFTIDSYSNQGGADFRTSDIDPQWLDIYLFDEEGRDLDSNSRRAIEHIYSRNDFRRAFFNEFGEIYYPSRAREAYTVSVAEKIDIEAIRKRKFKIVFDYRYGAASLLMPGLLGNFSCEVLSLNAYTDEKRLITSKPSIEESLKKLSEVVLSLGADLGLIFDNSAQRLAVIDDEGNRITGTGLLIVMTELVTRCLESGRIVIPVNQPSCIEKIAMSRGFDIERCKVGASSVMAAACSKDIVFAGDGSGGIIFPNFMPAYDAIMASSKLLELLAKTGEKISKIRERLPEYHIITKEIVVPWESKGTIMRKILESNSEKEINTIDGVKIFNEGGWVLFLPDEEEPVLHIFVEARTDHECSEMMDEYNRKVKAIQEARK
ncbi:MAG: mannose-1-phosphate guanyltransferase, partial [Actinomycetota bacterium]|nr:mannose-1-phosphate guanyltransferase [Actinomycetota bacterium]